MLKKILFLSLLVFSWVFVAVPSGMAETPQVLSSKEIIVHKSPW